MTDSTNKRNTLERIKSVRKVVRRFADNSHMAIYAHQREQDKVSAYEFIESNVDDEATRQELRDFYDTHAVKEQ